MGSQTYSSASAPACSGIYEVVVLDRQSLQEKTAAPESSPYCAASSATLTTYLGTLTPQDLAVVGTNYTKSADSALNTSAIGGLDHSKDQNAPLGYMTIGAGKTLAGSAYERAGQPVPRFDVRVCQRLSAGGYQWQLQLPILDVREYWVDPMDMDANAPKQSKHRLCKD